MLLITDSSRLSLQIFADIGIDMQEMLSFNYIPEENESTVWPGMIILLLCCIHSNEYACHNI